MISLYNLGCLKYVEDGKTFPDGTPLLESFSTKINIDKPTKVLFKYEGDSELFRLMCIVRDLQEKGATDISLILTYIPNARMDRVHDDADVFTLKYFAEFINSLNFTKVYVLDAHSDVSLALINRCVNIQPIDYIKYVMELLDFNEEEDFICYPDAGCKKRLEDKIKFPSVFGNKHRDWKSGKILGTDIYGDDLSKLNGARVLFVDDICAYSGTAKFTLEKLKQYGVDKCYCFFTHVEDSIFGSDNWQKTGEGVPTLLYSDLADGIYLTDSLLSSCYVNDCDLLTRNKMKVLSVERFIDSIK